MANSQRYRAGLLKEPIRQGKTPNGLLGEGFTICDCHIHWEQMPTFGTRYSVDVVSPFLSKKH